MSSQLQDEEHASRVRACAEFLDPADQRARSYKADIILMLNRQFRRLTVSIDEIRQHDRTIADGLLNSPFEYSTCFNQALKDVVATLPDRPKKESAEEVVGMSMRDYGKSLTGVRFTTAHSLAVLANSHAIPVHSTRRI